MKMQCKMNSTSLATLLFSLAFLCGNGYALQVDLTRISAKIAELMNTNLGVKFMQNAYNNQHYNKIELKGANLLNALTNALDKKIAKVRDILTQWKSTIEEDYASTTNPLGEIRKFESCCTYNARMKFNYQFEREVDMQGVCELTFLNRQPNSNKFRRLNLQKTKAFTEKAYRDLENKGLYVYYGQEDGYYLQYPAMKYGDNDDCYIFDPRTRPWYISAATQKSKDVVFLVDVSRNINTKLQKELVTTFLKTLDPRDKLTVVPFASNLFLNPEHCFNSQLVQASPGNLLALKTYVISTIEKAKSGLPAHSLVSYTKAFKEAFKQFQTASKNPDKLIFLATAGVYNDVEADVMRAIFNGNQKFSSQIAISVFAVNDGMSGGRKLFHQHIVDQNCNSYGIAGCSLQTPNAGKFIHVTSESEMRNKFGSFFTFLNRGKSEVNFRYSFPYVDFFGTGILIALSIPTYKGPNLQGVASIDLVVSQLLTDVTYFKEGHNAYRFLIEQSGLVYQHPLLPKPVLAFEPTVPVDISLLEKGKAFSSVRSSMIRGDSSSKSLITERSFSRGDSSLEGALTFKKNYTYFWKPVPLTNFSLAVVIETLNANQYELKYGTTAQSPMVYHRFDRLARGPQYTFCRRSKYLVLTSSSSTKLPADAFGSPAKYYAEETTQVVKEIMNYFSTNKMAFPTIIESQTVANNLKKSINLTSSLDEIWKGTHLDYVGWRYIATEDGVFKIYPGVQIHPLYDPRSRPWYQRSLIYPDTTVISTPYQGATTATMIITFSHLIQRKFNSTSTDVAVMGLDFSLYYFKKFFYDNVNVCQSSQISHHCIIVDNSGLIIFHPDFMKAEENQQLQRQHITKMLPGVAKDLIKDGYLKRESCIGIYNTNKSSTSPVPHLQYFYMLNVTKTVSKAPTPTKDCPEYSLIPVTSTNVYVLLVPKSCLSKETCLCPKDGTCTKPIDNYPCHCPCKLFLACDEYIKVIPTTLVCPPPPTNLLLPVRTKEDEEKDFKEAMSLQRCNDPKCRAVSSWENCTKIGCQWCFLNSDGKLLRSGDRFCGYSEECPRGKSVPIALERSKDTDSVNIVAIVVPIILVLIIVVAIAVAVYWFRHRTKHAETTKPPPMEMAVPTPKSTEVMI